MLFFITNIGCGYHFNNYGLHISNNIKTITIHSNITSYDAMFMQFIKTELKTKNIKVVNDINHKSCSLKINNLFENKKTISIFQNGKTASYQMILTIHAKIIIPGKKCYPINVSVCHYLFDNSLRVLAKDTESDMLKQEMRQQAAQQLVNKILLMPCFSTKSTF